MHPKAKNYLIILLTAATACSGYLAWQQTQRLAAMQEELLKASPAKASRKERTAPIKTELPSTTAKPVATEASESAAQPEETAKPNQKRNNARPDFAALMANPEFAQALSVQQRASLDGRYADLFKKLRLAPSELEKLKTALDQVEQAVKAGDYAKAQSLSAQINPIKKEGHSKFKLD